MKKYIKPQIDVPGVEPTISTTTIKDKDNILSKEYSFEDDWGYEE